MQEDERPSQPHGHEEGDAAGAEQALEDVAAAKRALAARQHGGGIWGGVAVGAMPVARRIDGAVAVAVTAE